VGRWVEGHWLVVVAAVVEVVGWEEQDQLVQAVVAIVGIAAAAVAVAAFVVGAAAAVAVVFAEGIVGIVVAAADPQPVEAIPEYQVDSPE
jgi:hypothetical protein